jgi:hypothetical protein
LHRTCPFHPFSLSFINEEGRGKEEGKRGERRREKGRKGFSSSCLQKNIGAHD